MKEQYGGMFKTAYNNRFLLAVQKSAVAFLILILTFAPVESWLQSALHINLSWLPDIKAVLADAGDFSIYRNESNTDTIQFTGLEKEVIWDTIVTENANIELQAGSTTIDLVEGGKYLVLYNVWAEETGGGQEYRRSFETYLTINEAELAYGRGDGYIRDNSGDDQYAYANGAAVIDVSAGDDLEINIARDDSNSDNNTRIRAGTNGASILKLKDDFDYLRVYKDTRSADISANTSFTDVSWDVSDEVDTVSFGFTDGDADITLKGNEGDYFLITSNVRLNQDANSSNRQNFESRLTLDGVEVPGTRVSAYLRGNSNSNGIYNGTLTYAGLVRKTSSGAQTLNVEVRRESSGTAAATDIVADETALTAVALPSDAHFISLTSTSSQALPSSRTALDFDEQLEVETTAFSHSEVTNPSRINIDLDGDYLFFSNVYATRTSSGDRDPVRVEWQLDGSTLVEYGGHGSFNRGDQGSNDAFTSGSAGGLILNGLTDTQYIEVTAFDEEDGSVSTIPARGVAVQGVELSLLFQTNVEVSATGTQETSVDIASTDQTLGGAFAIVENSTTRNITNISITESGSIDAQNGLDNIEMYYDLDTTFPYDCASESFTGTSTETQFGATDTNGFSGADGTVSFNDTVSISTSQTFCGYVVYDVTDSANDGDTINIGIADSSSDVVVTGGGTVGPGTNVTPTGSTTARNAELTQVHYHWLNDDGVEGSASEVEAEDTPATGFQNGVINRLRMQVSAEGSTSSVPTTLRLEYATSTGVCTAATGWTDVGATDGAWDMSNSSNITDGNDSSDLTPANGGTTNENSTHITTNGALLDVNSEIASALTFATNNFLELEFAIEPTTFAVEGTTYCFRLTDQGTALRNYDVYPEGTVSADITVSATSSQISSIDIGSVNAYLGGGFVIERPGGSRTVTSITLTETGTVDAQNNLSNIGLWYDLDTTSPYDCTGETFNGDETQFGATSTSFSSANGTTTFSGSESINNTRTMCPYVVLSVGSGAQNNETIDIEISNPSTDVVVTTSSVGPSSALSPTGSTTLAGPVLDQYGFHWRNDDGDKSGGGSGANSATAGIENTNITEIPKNSTRRIRLLIRNTGTVEAVGTAYRIEYGTKVTTCANVSSWNEVGVGTAFDMADSTHLTDGETSFDITVSKGGVTNPGGVAYEFTNDGILDVSSESAGISLEGNEVVEIEYSLEATADAGDGTTYCFRVSDAGTALQSYSQYPELTTREKQDFYVQHGSTTITGTTTTLTAGIDYIAPSASSAAFVRITNTKFTGAGENQDDDNNATVDGFTAYISEASDITSSFTIDRPSDTANSADTRVYWEILEFTGLAATDNEMIVRDVGTVTYGTSDLHATGSAVSDIADDSDVVVFITGQFNPDTGTGNFNWMLSTSYWHATDTVPVFTRNETGNASRVSYAVVEYTGANWNVQRVEHAYTSTSTEQENITPVSSITQAFIHAQKRSGEEGLHDQGDEVWLSSVGVVSFQLMADTGSDVDNASVHDSVAWVIENTQSGSGAMTVYQSNGRLSSGGSEPATSLVSIGGTIDPDNASIFVTNNSTGEGSAFPRGVVAARIYSTTQYELWVSDTGQNFDYRTEVVEWPVAEISVRQNYYRFYVDNDALTPTDPWPVGATDLGENTSITGINDPLGEGERVRIRMSLLINNATLPAETVSYKLQYARRVSSCSALSSGDWNDLGDPGSGSVWRGYDGTPSDEASVPSSLLTGIPNTVRLGTYEEQNNTAVNPVSVGLGEDIEFDWHVEHNGAIQQSDYCFRMVQSDGTELDGYNHYPTLRTTGYTPVSSDWRWYGDESNATPVTPLAATNTAPTNIANTEPMKLRIVAEEVEGASGDNVKFQLQFSEYSNFSDGGSFVLASSSCTGSSTWCYADGGGVDNAVIDTSVISTAASCSSGVGPGCGTHNEFPTTTSTFTHQANTATEFEFTIRSAGPRVNAVYYFRLYDVTNDGPLVASSSYPSVATEGGALQFSMEGVSSGQVTEGVTTDVTTTPVSVPFGEIQTNNDYVAAYRLNIDTNATEGYQVFMYARQPLTDELGNEIPGVAATNASPGAWSSVCLPSATGCLGYHAGDDSLSGGSTRFAPDDTYAAFSTSTLDEVMFSSQPAIDDSTDIIVRLEVDDLQPAGNYQNEIVFISVPIF